MSDNSKQRDQILTTVTRSRLIRQPIQLLCAVFFLLTAAPRFPELLAVLCILLTANFIFYVFCTLTLKQHLLHSPAVTAADMVLTAVLLFAVNQFLFLPFVFILTAEAVLEKQDRKLIFSFILATAAMLICGLIINREYLSVPYAAAAILAQTGTVLLLNIQNNTNKIKYEYMKKLVDNKNKLLSTLTHELRTPLAVIKTSNELIMEERPGPINETQRSLIHSSIENTKRLNSLVENILSQVKVEFAWFSMKQQPLDIRTIIRKTALDIKPYLDTKQQRLKYNYPSLLSKTIGDKRWLEQVLLNLIHNGSKNSPEGTEITIGVQENEQCIVVSVYDRGSGIENKEIPNVFNEFYQSTNPAKNLNEGAGLGLTIVKDIIERHKGEVYISSLPHAGTTVSFTLPLYKGVFSGTNSSNN